MFLNREMERFIFMDDLGITTRRCRRAIRNRIAERGITADDGTLWKRQATAAATEGECLKI